MKWFSCYDATGLKLGLGSTLFWDVFQYVSEHSTEILVWSCFVLTSSVEFTNMLLTNYICIGLFVADSDKYGILLLDSVWETDPANCFWSSSCCGAAGNICNKVIRIFCSNFIEIVFWHCNIITGYLFYCGQLYIITFWDCDFGTVQVEVVAIELTVRRIIALSL